MFEIEYYRSPGGKEEVALFLESLPRKHLAKAFWELDLLAEFGTGLREPYAKHLENGLWELRIKFASDISRVFYFLPLPNRIVLLHGFLKKSQKTPRRELAIAISRKNEYLERNV